MRILYLEDEANDARLVTRYVQTTGHEIKWVDSVAGVEDALQAEPFDLIMLDLLIDQQRSGYELASWLRQSGFDLPIIAITGLNTPRDAQDQAQIGFDAILTKPFQITELAKLLSQFD